MISFSFTWDATLALETYESASISLYWSIDAEDDSLSTLAFFLNRFATGSCSLDIFDITIFNYKELINDYIITVKLASRKTLNYPSADVD